MNRRRDLHDGWTLSAVPGQTSGDSPPGIPGARVPAQVPGCVHTDLLAAGLIADPYLDQNEADQAWIGRTGWQYETTFDWVGAPGARTDLVCAGLDTVASVTLNGTAVGATQNMHRSYRFDVTETVRPGANRLMIRFASAVEHAERVRDRMGDLPVPETASVHPINFIRKMACNFGWDWGPELVTAGIWRPIGLESWTTARLAAVRPAVTVDDGRGRVRVGIDIERDGDPGPLRVSARIGDQVVRTTTEGTTAQLVIDVADAELWWPHGYGGQRLYDLQVELTDVGRPAGAEAVLDHWGRRIGFRSVELDTRPDDGGSAFTLVVNGMPVFARGANWIPDDCFPSRVTAQRYRTRVTQSRDANVNLLRVWGGGIYEQGDFYDACDELGVMVWQDFLFACAAYPEEEPIASEVAAEATENVTRLMPHPSLVLWNGNNETFMGWHEWGWPEVVGDRTWGLGYYTDVLPRIVADVDGTRPYWPGSPYSGSPDLPSGLDEHGCKHIWDVWNTADYPTYRDYVPRFVAEFGWQAPPTWATLTAAVHDSPLRPDSPGVLAHQKARDGNGKLARGLAPHFPAPSTAEDWHFATQLNQCRAITTAVEHFRSHRGTCMGTVVWQLNDCWPVTSWSAIDGYGRRKPLWYALRRVYDPRLVTVQPRPDGLHVVLVNDGLEEWPAVAVVQRLDVEGTVLATAASAEHAPAGSVREGRVPAEVAVPVEPRREFLLVTVGDRRSTWFFVEDKDFEFPEPRYRLDVPAGPDPAVSVFAETMLRDVVLFADRLDPSGQVDDMLITLLPGETHVFHLTGVTDLAAADLAAPVLRTAYDAVHPR